MDKLLEEPFVLTIYGPRKVGKSYFIKTFLKKKLAKFFDEIHVLCSSLDFNFDYDDFRKLSYPYRKKFKWYPFPTSGDLEKIFEDQSKEQERFVHYKRRDQMINMAKNRSKNNRKIPYPDEVENPKPIDIRQPFGFFTEDVGMFADSKHIADHPKRVKKILTILDDVVDSGTLNRGTSVDTYAMRGRHINVSIITVSQRISPTSINLRDNADMMICFMPSSVQEFEGLIDKFIPTNNKKCARQKICAVFDEPYEFVLVDNMGTKPYEKIGKSNCNDFLNNHVEIINVIDSNKLFA